MLIGVRECMISYLPFKSGLTLTHAMKKESLDFFARRQGWLLASSAEEEKIVLCSFSLCEKNYIFHFSLFPIRSLLKNASLAKKAYFIILIS